MSTSRCVLVLVLVGALAGPGVVPALAGEPEASDDLPPPPLPVPGPAAAAPAEDPVAPPAPPPAPPLPFAFADEEPPSAPPPPPPIDGEEIPLAEEGEAPLPGDLVPADEVMPPPEGYLERVPCLPEPCPPPRAADCCWLRDDCGRPLDWCERPIGFWDVTVEATGTDLEDPEGPLGVARPGGVSWGAHDYDPEFGGRITVGYVVNRTDRLELRGGWSGEWRDASSQTGVFGFTPPPAGTSAVGTFAMRSRAEVFGGEATWWRELCCRGTWRFLGGLGYRFVSFEETARVDGILVVPAVVGFVQATSENQFHMAQLAGAVEKRIGRRFEAALSLKALLGGVSRDVRVRDANVLAGGAHAARNDDSDLAWGGEFELTLRYHLSAGLALTAGYTLLYLDAVVRADDGMDFTQAATGVVQARQATESLLSQSVFAGIRVRF